jgi:RNA polymerase-binding transcription factor DksA
MPTLFAPSTLAEMAARLESRRRSSRRLAASMHRDAASALDGLDLSDLLDTDSPDGSTNGVDHVRALQLAEHASHTASEADEALSRLAAGTYGTCHRCHEQIPLARLRAMPETRLCVSCKADEGRMLAGAR